MSRCPGVPVFWVSFSPVLVCGTLPRLAVLTWPFRKSLSLSLSLSLSSFLLFFLSQRGEGREKERERNITVWLPLACPQLGTRPTTEACALTGNQTNNPLVCRPAHNPLSHTSQGYELVQSFAIIPVQMLPSLSTTFDFSVIGQIGYRVGLCQIVQLFSREKLMFLFEMYYFSNIG